MTDIDDKSMVSGDRRYARTMLNAIRARLDESRAFNIPLTKEMVEKYRAMVEVELSSPFPRDRIAAGKLMQSMLEYNLKSESEIDKMASGGNGPAQVSPKIYVNTKPPLE